MILHLVECNYVKPDRMAGIFWLASQEHRCGPHQLALFATINRFCSCRKVTALSVANLDNNNALPVEHDQVYFPEPAAKVFANQNQPIFSQKLQCAAFGIAARYLR